MKALQRLEQQAARMRTAPGVRVTVRRGRMALKIGSIKIWVPGYTITVNSARALPVVVRVRTSKACSDILRGISIGSYAAIS